MVYSIAPAPRACLTTLAMVGRLLADRRRRCRKVLALLVDDRVDRHGGLAGLAVADDQLALAAADRHHRVDRLEAGLHRLRHRLAPITPGATFSITSVSSALIGPLPSDTVVTETTVPGSALRCQHRGSRSWP